jgi:Beta-glucosidase-related glycosidases
MSNLVSELLAKMTTEEKIGQLIQLTGDFFQDGKAAITGPINELAHLKLQTVYSVGSVLGVSGAADVRRIQENYLANNRLKIPLLFMADVVHGYQTIFPIPLGLGASFDPTVMETASGIAAKESVAAGLHVTFAPMVDLVRDPRWGRVMESTGEDPHLNSVMAQAAVKGFQGDSPWDEKHLAASVKHFAAYGAPEAGREYNTVDMSEWRFREQYLPAYSAAIKAQAMLVMTSFNTLFGVPATQNQHLLRDILRDELGFHGVVITDWNAIEELVHHGTVRDLKDAAQKALAAGVDIDMMAFAYAEFLNKAVELEPGVLKLIDESAQRILELKETMGLFADPYRGLDESKEKDPEFIRDNLVQAQKAAEESLVLVKNHRQTLPLSQQQKLAVIGPVAQTGDLLGSWSWKGDVNTTQSIADALVDTFAEIVTAPGCGYHSFNKQQVEQAKLLASDADVIVAAIGLPSSESGEATSITDISIPAEQIALLKELKTLNKPLISVVITGRPLLLKEVHTLSDAVLIGWYPGSKGAQAIANILSGKVEPSGRLPMTFPLSLGQVPLYYNAYSTGRPIEVGQKNGEYKYVTKYVDSPNEPLYPFGFGLGYGKILLTDMTMVSNSLKMNDQLILDVTLTNDSPRDSKTVLQCYTHQKVGETVRPLKELKWFKK